MECQATFKEHCTSPKCDCDRDACAECGGLKELWVGAYVVRCPKCSDEFTDSTRKL